MSTVEITALSPAELSRKSELEATIERGQKTFIEVGTALWEIRESKLYRDEFSIWEDYCRERWGWSRRHANRHIAAVQIAEILGPMGPISTERQAREFAPILQLEEGEAEAIIETLQEVHGEEIPKEVLIEAVKENLESKRLPSKPDLGAGISHPARFPGELLPIFADTLRGHLRVLDPFAGTGRVHELRPEFETTGIEIEIEWAKLSPFTLVGDARALPFDDESFDAICTSPTYGNRLADHHNAVDPELRRSYTHDLGRALSEGNSGSMQWGDEYRALHTAAWTEAVRVLRPGGRFVLNIKDHIRAGARQPVSGWHVGTLQDLGLKVIDIVPVVPRHLNAGANANARVDAELVVVMDK